MRARVIVRLKPGVLDPQGAAVEKSLQSLGFAGVRGVRISKMIELDVDANDVADARAKVTAMAEQLLRNPVIEDATVSVDNGEGA
jgi:phosphoribosylformylglycinamidine synthase PurS subunit